jgi:hypothetical protein
LQHLRSFRYLTFHAAKLLVDPSGGMIQHQIEEVNSGFDIAERLAKVVDEAVENFFIRRGRRHRGKSRDSVSIAQWKAVGGSFQRSIF